MLLEVELNEKEIHKDDTDGLFRDSLIQLPPLITTNLKMKEKLKR